MSQPDKGQPEPAPEAAPGVDLLYRVYAQSAEMPPLEKLLARLTSGNPYNPPGGFIFPPGRGLRRLQDALGASADHFVMGYLREEAPDLFDSVERAVAEGQGRGLEDHDRAVLAGPRLCVVLRATIASPENNDYVETMVHVTDAIASLLDGVVWDVPMRVVWGQTEWRQRVMEEPFTVLNHVDVQRASGTLRTHGLRKFGSPDLEVVDVPAELSAVVEGLLRDIAENLAQGEVLGAGETLEYGGGRLRVVAATRGDDRVVRLVDEDAPEEGEQAHGIPKLIAILREAKGTER